MNKQQEPRKSPSKEDLSRWSAVKKLIPGLNQGKLAREIDLTEEEKEASKSLQLLTAKPMFVIANVDEEDLRKDLGENVIPICAKTESELSELSKEEQQDYLKELGLKESGLERVIKKGYEILDLISFLTAGEKEVRAWTIKKGTTAQNAAGVIHTDFIKGFIKAEVVSFNDFTENGGWKGSREHGKTRFEGKEYVMKDGDVVDFKINS